MPLILIGIDPGVSGGIVAIGDGLLRTHNMPATLGDMLDLARELATLGEAMAFMEELPGAPGHYDKDARVYKMQTSPKSYGVLERNRGRLETAFMAAGIEVTPVHAKTWQNAVSLPPGKKGETTTVKKNRHKARAQQLFPGAKVTHFVADALLVAYYGRLRSKSFAEKVSQGAAP